MRQAQGTPSFLNPFFLLSWAAPIPKAWSGARVQQGVSTWRCHLGRAMCPWQCSQGTESVLMGDGNEHPISLFAKPKWKSSPMGRRLSAAAVHPWMGSLRVFEMTF